MLWGSVFPLAQVVMHHMSDISLAIWRFALSTFGIGVYCIIRKEHWPRLSPAAYLGLLILGVVGVGVFNIVFLGGLSQTSATNGALIMSLSPAVTTLLSALFALKIPEKKMMLSLLLSFIGVIVVITHGQADVLLHMQFNHGDLYMFAAMLTWSFYTLFSQKMANYLSPLLLTFSTMLTGTLTLVVVSLYSHITPVHELLQLSGSSLSLLVYIGLIATVLGYAFWVNGISKFGAPKASLFYNLLPVFAALMAYLLGQPLTSIQIAGMVIVLAGLSVSKFKWQPIKTSQST